MFSLIKQVFIVLLRFSESLETKCMFLNDELCKVIPTLIDLNSVKFKYTYLNTCTGSCDVLSLKICVPKETKDINVNAFNMITNKNENKTMTKHFSYDSK